MRYVTMPSRFADAFRGVGLGMLLMFVCTIFIGLAESFTPAGLWKGLIAGAIVASVIGIPVLLYSLFEIAFSQKRSGS